MSDPVTITSSKCSGLLFLGMQAQERLGELFRFELQFESRDTEIDLSGLLASTMTVSIALEDGFKRHFNGMVCEATQTGVNRVDGLLYAQYGVSLVPRPWLLAQQVDCRIYTHMKVPDIIRQLLQEAGYTDVKNSLAGNYAQRDYCVQYREDGLSFIHRLMEQEGIYYYFTHDTDKHTLVLADGVGAHVAAAGFKNVPFAPGGDTVLAAEAFVETFAATHGVDAATVRLTDYNPLTPKASLLSSHTSDGSQPAASHSSFDYPGTHGVADVGRHYASVRAEALTAARSGYRGSTHAGSAGIGHLFTLKGHPRAALNQEYLLTATHIELRGGGHASGHGDTLDFACHFEALAGAVPFRLPPRTARPHIPGLQTAIVTGSDTDEDIVVDEHGRVQVNFHWNMPDKPKAQCSCPVRVASSWAGKSWGAVSLPRVGQEVVVSFIEGDPDRPLIIGSVYNAANTVPYGLPANKTQSGIKSRSLLGGAADFNELRFEDKKGSEDFFIHAQKDMHEEVENDHVVTIDHDETVTVKHDQTLTVDNDQTETIKHDRKVAVQNDDKLDVTANGTTTVGQKFKLDAGTEIQLVCGASSITLKNTGDIEIKGVNIKITGDMSVKLAGTTSVDIGSEVNVKLHSSATMSVESSGMTTVKGAMLTLNGEGMAKLGGGITMIG